MKNLMSSFRSIARFLMGILLLVTPAAAQLDDTCIVSALNRTAPVRADGTWVLPNVPANVGLVRVRATCVGADGTTRSGQSDFFQVPADGVIEVADIVFDDPQPIPDRLVLEAPTTELTQVGETVQLTATAEFPTGTSTEVTAGTSGTTYVSSNPAVLSVSPDGLVTALASGVALVSATHEGTLGLVTLRVVTSADSDGDGVSDDVEIANGLDPNDAADAFGDPDADGLSTRDELDIGLDPFNPDTDGDGLLDGDEATFIGTNPLLFDTDGDQISDGLEVQVGSDPLDPTSFDLAPLLTTISVEPSAFTLVFNTVLGEASRRLTVSGMLIDGSTLDITSTRFGTQYSSSDLTIVSFGAVGGQVFAGQDGSATITVENSGFVATADVEVSTFSPVGLAFVFLPGFANAVAVDGNFAYVAAGSAGLQVVDVTVPETAFAVGSATTPGTANDVEVSRGRAYVADAEGGLRIFDLAAPASPLEVGFAATPGPALDVAAAGSLVYVADGLGLRVIDAADPAMPFVDGGLDLPGNARGVDVSGTLAVVAAEAGGVHVVDVNDPAAPVLLGSTHTRPSSFSSAADVEVRDRLAYVADGARTLGGVRIIDLSVPSTPVVVATTSNRFGLNDIALDGSLALTADYFFVNAVPIFDVGLSPPVFREVIDFRRVPTRRDDNGHGIAVRDGLAFLAADRFATRTSGSASHGNGGLHIGRYLALEDRLGVPPSVSIVEPLEGFEVRERRSLSVVADAIDDIRVAAVELIVNGQRIEADFRAPYEFSFEVPVGVPSLTLEAIAMDLGGNQGFAEPVEVSVLPDDSPAVRILAPVGGSEITEGAQIEIAVAATDDLGVASVELLVDGTLQGTRSTPPFTFDFTVPLGASSVTFQAAAEDGVGQRTESGPVVLTIVPDEAPAVTLLDPEDGSEVVADGLLTLLVGATDDIGVERVRFLVDGVVVAVDTLLPYETTITVPASASELRLAAGAVDTLGQETTSPEIVVSVIPDPLTTVIGSTVLENGSVVSGASVSCLGVQGTSDEEGRYSISGVPTGSGDVSCSATATDAQGGLFLGSSVTVSPVAAGVTDVGVMTLVESAFIEEVGTFLGLSDDDSATISLPFSFPFFGQTFDTVFVNSNGNLTFGAASPFDWTEDATEFVSGFRSQDGINPGPSIAPFWDDLQPLANADGELDFIRFEASAGAALVAEVDASRSGSFLDPVLTLFDATGAVIAFNDDFFGLDSRIETTLPADGAYFLELRDFSRTGGSEYFYRLTVELDGLSAASVVQEIEPNNDLASSFAVQPSVVVEGIIDLLNNEDRTNVFVNDQLAGRFVVTWNRVPEFPVVGSNRIQAVLFDDGRIQFNYDGLTADDGLVGLSPATGGDFVSADYTQDLPLSVPPGTAVFEEFDGPVGPDGTGEDPPGTRPFDLDSQTLVFNPRADAGYDVSLRGGASGGTSNLILGARSEERSILVSEGSVEGIVMIGGDPVGVEVLVTSSGDPSYEGRAGVDENGAFRLGGVPSGGINLRAYRGLELIGQAAGVLDATEGAILSVHVLPAAPKAKGGS